jgi:hypothetical protein
MRCREFLLAKGLVRFIKDWDNEDIIRLSAFIPNSSLPSLNDTQSEGGLLRSQLFRDIFISNGRVAHHERMMACYPFYLKRHKELMTHLMTEPGALAICWRHYLAFMVRGM